jgi:hypothetical protein
MCLAWGSARFGSILGDTDWGQTLMSAIFERCSESVPQTLVMIGVQRLPSSNFQIPTKRIHGELGRSAGHRH